MKRLIIVLFSALLIFAAALPLRSYAEDGIEDEITAEVDDILSAYDTGYSLGDTAGLSFSGFFGLIRERTVSRLTAPLRLLGTIILLSVLYSVFRSITSGGSAMSGSGLFGMISVMTAVTAIVPPLLGVYSSSLEAIRVTAGFMLVYVPVFAGITAFSGGLASAGIYHMMILAASELLLKLSGSYLLPVLTVCTVLSVSGSVFPNSSSEGIVRVLKKVITLVISLTATLFSSFLSLKCTIAGKADSAGDKTIKMLLSGSVPVIGGAVSDAYSTVKCSLGVIRSTVGAAGIIAIAVLLLPPVIELLAYRLVMWIGTAAAELFSASPIAGLLRSIDDGLSIAQCVMTAQCGMLMICTAIFINAAE
ncbi:MAG: hypothetical protein IJ874_04350 [Ruminococcus sp.]|nr:hypothetical protein [Ruminococcus sp.]